MTRKDFQEYIYRALKVEAAKNNRFWIDKTVYVFGNVWIVYAHFSGKLCQQVQPGGNTLYENKINKYTLMYTKVVCI